MHLMEDTHTRSGGFPSRFFPDEQGEAIYTGRKWRRWKFLDISRVYVFTWTDASPGVLHALPCCYRENLVGNSLEEVCCLTTIVIGSITRVDLYGSL